MLKKIIIYCSLLVFISVPSIKAKDPTEPYQIRYEYLGSYKALVGTPKGIGPFPVIIYNYDEFYDWAGDTLAEKVGYNLSTIASYYAEKGYLTVIPLKRFRKINSIIGVIKTLQEKDYIQKNNIHLIGISEGAFMNILASQKSSGIASISCIGPIFINNKGYLSQDFFLMNPIYFKNIPIFFLFINDVSWRVQNQKRVLTFLKNRFKNISVKKYNKKKKWFWNSDNSFNKDIYYFIERHN